MPLQPAARNKVLKDTIKIGSWLNCYLLTHNTDPLSWIPLLYLNDS